jgi:fucose 4-O-acetylase-like acetyltransferase
MTERYPELDLLKAVGIVAVVLIHALPPFWVPGSHGMALELTRFAVPSFLAVSGFLYYQPQPVSLRVLGRRLRRILPPYVCVSLLVYAYSFARPHHVSADSLLQGLLLCSMFGVYYYVFVLIEMLCLTLIFSRLGRRAVTSLFVITSVALVWMMLSAWDTTLGLIWVVRNPLLWTPWFLLGWVTAAHRQTVLPFTSRHRQAILLACVVVIAAWATFFLTGTLVGRVQRTAGVPLMAATMVGVFAFARGRQKNPPLVDAISESTYAIYLLHPFFTQEVLRFLAPWSPASSPVSIVLAWASGLLGSGVTIVAARRLLGEYSKDVIGA